MTPRKVNLAQKFEEFREHWSPKIAGEVNDSYVKLVKFQGEFVWHKHENEDEMFLVVPKGVEHCPFAPEEAQVLLFEPKTTLNTGDVVNERTREKLDRI